MLKGFILLMLFSLALGGSVNAMNSIDSFIRDRCGSACNGESDDCRNCYNEAVDLFDQYSPTSPEVEWDLHMDQGKLKLTF